MRAIHFLLSERIYNDLKKLAANRSAQLGIKVTVTDLCRLAILKHYKDSLPEDLDISDEAID